jgi:polysaccharide pyruvyl transferase WcaK-like protein
LRLSPDVAFALSAAAVDAPRIIPPLPEQADCSLIGLNISGLLFRGGYSRANMFGLKLDYPSFLQQLVPPLLAAPGSRLLCVPHTYAEPGRVESDNGAAAEFLERLPPHLRDRVHVVVGEYDQHELKGIIGTCDFFVGARMHACIAALSQGIPTAGVAYSDKFTGVFDTLGAGDWVIDARTLDDASAVAQIIALYESRDKLRVHLSETLPGVREKLLDAFARLVAG